MGSTMDSFAVKDFFSLKKCLKTALWAARFSDHLTSERASTHNFKDHLQSISPEDSENVVLFVPATFLTGVIAAQSQQRAAKVGVSP